MKKTTLLLMMIISIGVKAATEFSFPQEYVRETQLNNYVGLEEELKILAEQPFIAISLGENCFFANHLKEHGIRVRSFPFDWDITPFKALYEIIKHDFKGLLDLSNLKIIPHEYTVYNMLYGIKLNHDFDINDWTDGPQGLEPKEAASLKKYEHTLSYYNRRIARFYGVFTLGVPLYLFRRVIQSHEARALYNLFKTKFPYTPFKLVCIQDKEHEPYEAWQGLPADIIYCHSDEIISYVHEVKNPRATALFENLGLLNY